MIQLLVDLGEAPSGGSSPATAPCSRGRRPQAVSSEPWFAAMPGATRIVAMGREAFAGRFGDPDVSGTLCGYTRKADTRAVLATLVHARLPRVLEVGTAFGHMTANFTRWTPEDARVFTIDVVRGMGRAAASAGEQRVEVPPRAEWGQLADQLGARPQGVLHHGRHDDV